MDLSIIVPCFDEQENIGALAERVGAVLRDLPLARVELVLVDDGSRDGTWSEIERVRGAHPFVTAARHDGNRGLAAAWRTGLDRARGRLVCILDADLQYRPEDLPRLYEALGASGCDIVQGWRSRAARKIDSRFVISRGLNTLLNTLFGMHLEDNKSGFILCRREVLEDLLAYRGHYRYWQIFLLVAAHAKGYRVHEVETRFEERRAGRSFLSAFPVKVILHALVDIGRAIIEYRPRGSA
ncbi:glycosyltransferase family 2 protein [Pendulispora albinea]|uniref:Glycosyltransferase family 2 protein n=1 Tax=Pendulispora albinea TaxID=2741071 RepID=A0ABZ2LNV6_9BACT